MDITLDDVLTILDKHYNNIKALDSQNRELFQLQMGEKETISDWGVCLPRHLQAIAASFLECFPPDCVAELKHDHFCGGLPKRLKAMVTYLKASPQEKTYYDYQQAAREAKKEDSMEPYQSHTLNNTTTPKSASFFPLWKLKGTQPVVKMPAVLVHLEEESAEKDEAVDGEDPDGIEGVTEEFMLHLVRAMKDAQKEEKCCYHCSSLDHFIHDCPLVEASRTNSHLNHEETVPKKGGQAPQMKVTIPMMPPEGVPQA